LQVLYDKFTIMYVVIVVNNFQHVLVSL